MITSKANALAFSATSKKPYIDMFGDMLKKPNLDKILQEVSKIKEKLIETVVNKAPHQELKAFVVDKIAKGEEALQNLIKKVETGFNEVTDKDGSIIKGKVMDHIKEKLSKLEQVDRKIVKGTDGADTVNITESTKIVNLGKDTHPDIIKILQGNNVADNSKTLIFNFHEGDKIEYSDSFTVNSVKSVNHGFINSVTADGANLFILSDTDLFVNQDNIFVHNTDTIG